MQASTAQEEVERAFPEKQSRWAAAHSVEARQAAEDLAKLALRFPGSGAQAELSAEA